MPDERASRKPPRVDRTLVEDCLRRDEGAWEELLARYGRLIYSIPHRMGLDGSDCDEVMQIVISIVLRRLATLREVQRLSGWLIQTTYREAWRRSAERCAERQADVPQDAPSDATPACDEVARMERQQLAREALAELGGRCQDLLELLLFGPDEPDYQTITHTLGMAVGSVAPTRARCFEKLTPLLKARGL